MGVEHFTIATTVSVNDDTISGKRFSRRPYSRRLLSIGLAGSANPGDFGIKATVEGVPMGDFYNLKAGANTMPDRDTAYRTGIPIPANYLLELLALVAPTTNAGTVVLETIP